ncbi:MAG: 13E12 repeat family protein, partial [Micrococcales bacterium]|nr:13E12 repeat family protein [Micrococcales bacterium]
MLQGREPTGTSALGTIALDTVARYDNDLDTKTSSHDIDRGVDVFGDGESGSVLFGLAAIPAGPALAALLDQIDMAEVCDAELAVVLAAYDRMASWAYEGTTRASAQISHRVASASCQSGRKDYGQGQFSAATHEVALALGISRGSARRLVAEGWAMDTALGEVAEALRTGDLPVGHAKVLVSRLGEEPEQVCQAVLGAVLPTARELTPRTLGIEVDKTLHALDPDRATVDQEARGWRRVGSPCPLGQGMASLTAVLPVLDAARVDRTLEQVARAARARGDERTLGELRADAMVDLLTGDAYPTSQSHTSSGQVAPDSRPDDAQPHDPRHEPDDEQGEPSPHPTWRLPPPGSV